MLFLFIHLFMWVFYWLVLCDFFQHLDFSRKCWFLMNAEVLSLHVSVSKFCSEWVIISLASQSYSDVCVISLITQLLVFFFWDLFVVISQLQTSEHLNFWSTVYMLLFDELCSHFIDLHLSNTECHFSAQSHHNYCMLLSLATKLRKYK